MEEELISTIHILDRTVPGGRHVSSGKHHKWDKLFIRVKLADKTKKNNQFPSRLRTSTETHIADNEPPPECLRLLQPPGYPIEDRSDGRHRTFIAVSLGGQRREHNRNRSEVTVSVGQLPPKCGQLHRELERVLGLGLFAMW
jgi:hypothetical protein